MTERITSAVGEILESPDIRLTKFERHVLLSILKKNTISRDTQREFDDSSTFGERLSDHVAQFGGSWTFIIVFILLLTAWIALNSFLLIKWGRGAFDPYPFILLNLFLSMTTAVQAPIIMMSQNRQAEKDRLQAANDYEVNLKAELEIRSLHEKLDELHTGEWAELLKVQQKQILLLEGLLADKVPQSTGK